MTVHYESLGRYTAATEMLDKALRERNRQLSELKRLIDRVVDTASGWNVPVSFDFQTAQRLLKEAEDQHAVAAGALADANSASVLAQRPPRQWR